jgi:hypothetical protein
MPSPYWRELIGMHLAYENEGRTVRILQSLPETPVTFFVPLGIHSMQRQYRPMQKRLLPNEVGS